MEYFSGDPVYTYHWDHVVFLLLRPIIAVVFSLSVIFFVWFLAWKLVLVHVPLVQEIFGLRKKTVRPKPAETRCRTQQEIELLSMMPPGVTLQL
ncbi:Unknown protein [Striga hermonthica]|uniref:Uncharacterized protein n=1 Tax=Striga hermonthica TaxID=68872 RepID=A0A9N7RA71_STRHE|nr:Unknown protein [Striga hermonthica]